MKRAEIIRKTEQTLQRVGFYVSSTALLSGVSFDLIARRDNQLLVVKVFSNVDSLDKQVARELGLLARLLNGSALVVGFRSTSGPLENGVLYKRYELPIITPETLFDYFVEGTAPIVEAGKGGYYVSINGKALERVRLEKKISLSFLASEAGVSKRTIQQYEKGMRTTIDIAIKLEELTGEELVQEQTLLRRRYDDVEDSGQESEVSLEGLSQLEQEVIGFLLDIGCKVHPLRHGKVSALTREKKNLIITGMSQPQRAKEKTQAISVLAKITERPSVFFLERDIRRTSLDGIPVIHKKELKRISDPDQIIEIIIERSE